MGSKGGGQAPKFQPSKDYEKMIQLQLKYLPQQLQAELANRQLYDPQFIEQALGTQAKYDPALAQEQLMALARRDPQWLQMHTTLGSKIQDALNKGYLDPRQEAAYQKASDLAGTVDPRYQAMYSGMAAQAGQVDPTRAAEYKALGQQVTSDTLRGTMDSPEVTRQKIQAILAHQPNLSYGEAQNMAIASARGIQGQQLQQQRQAAGEQFLGQQSNAQQAQQSYLQGLSAVDPTRFQQQSLAQFYGMPAPGLGAIGLAGTYLQPSNSITGQINQITGVNPPSAFRYVNPNAGSEGLQLGLQSQQFQYANQALNNSGGNPWTNALSGAAQGAGYGGTFGGGYGMAGGALVGAAAGAFGYPQYSDERLKQNISRTGLETPDGIPVVEYDYQGKRWRGVLAGDVQRVRPDAVYKPAGGAAMVFYEKLGVRVAEVEQNAEKEVL